MRTTSFISAGEMIRVHHNSDWSGDTVINIGNGKEVILPGDIFVQVAKTLFQEKLKDQLISMIEQVEL